MISVCMPTYNGEKYIKIQLESILSQLSTEDEVVISDDSSSDDTLQIIQDLNDSRIRILHGSFHSPIFNLENALKAAKGDYIFLSDQDDEWMPNKVEKMMKYLTKYDCVVSDAVVIDGEDRIINESFFKLRNSKTGKWYNLLRNCYLGCCMGFNRNILEKSLPFPKDIPMHDIWIGAVVEEFGKGYFLPEKLIKYRRHGDNASPTAEKSIYSFCGMFMFRYNIVKNIAKRKRIKN